jgi:hypothetical protein
MLRSSQLLHVSWNPSTYVKSNVLKSLSEESTVYSIVVVDTSSKKLKSWEHLCSSSKLSCPSTSPSVSLPISARTLVDRLSHSACLIIGKSSQETRTSLHRSHTRSCKTPVNARVLRKVSQTWHNTTTRCKAAAHVHIHLTKILFSICIFAVPIQFNFSFFGAQQARC